MMEGRGDSASPIYDKFVEQAKAKTKISYYDYTSKMVFWRERTKPI